MVKVELIEEKPQCRFHVLVEDILGHEIYHAPENIRRVKLKGYGPRKNPNKMDTPQPGKIPDKSAR